MLFSKLSHLKETKIFEESPALYISLWALFGHVFGLTYNFAFFIPLIPFLFEKWKKLALGILFFILFFMYAQKVDHIEQDVGFGIFKISDIQEQKGKLFIRGNIVYFNDAVRNVQSSILVKKGRADEVAFHKLLLFQGSVKNDRIKSKSYKAISYSQFSFPWLRFSLKKHLLSTLENHVPNGAVLSSLLFGTPVPKHISTSIKRFGLSHLFAISGFHFNLITTILALMLRPFVSHRIFHWLILSLLTLYAMLIGPNASLLRGFLSQAILFLGLALGKESFALNSLGVALFFITLFFPQLIPNIGFIFSFTITGALLLIFPLVSKYLLPEKPSWIMGPLSLLLTVELASIPLNLALFNSYPVLSPLYNLFVTPLISLALFLSPLSFLPYLSALVSIPLDLALMTFDIPASADIFIYYALPIQILIIYLTLLFFSALLIRLDEMTNFQTK